MRKLSLFIACLAITYSSFGQHSVFDANDPVVTYNSATPPVTPSYGTPAKWVRTVRITNWNTNNYKAYYYKGMAFRLRYPKNYDMSGNTKYPMVVFWHGRGEPGTVYDNERQLQNAAQHHENAILNDQFNGFLLFPQNTSGFFNDGHRTSVHELVNNFFIPFLHVDADRVVTHGLSGGGYSVWSYLTAYPSDIAAALPMSATSTNNIPDIANFKHVPIWLVQGFLDRAPSPNTSQQVVDAFVAQGGNMRYTVYKNLGHGTWNTAYAEADFWPYILRAHKTVPTVLDGEMILVSTSSTRDVFEFKTKYEPCPGEPINVKLGISPGFEAYEWRKDGVVISGAINNEHIATSFGVYDARFKRNGVWSQWSVRSIEVKQKTPTVTPNIQVTGLMSKVIPALDGETGISLEMPEGYIAYAWKLNNTSTNLSTNRIFYATQPGQYVATVTEKFGCSSSFSPPFAVVPAAGTNTPPALSSVAGAAMSKTSIKLQWTNIQNPTNPATEYEIYRSVVPGSSYDLIAVAGANDTEYTDNDLTANTYYYYVIRPVNSTGAATASSELGIRTEVDVKAPTTPLNLRVTRVNSTEVALAWDASNDDVNVYRYDVYRNGSVAVVTPGTSAVVFNLIENQTYQFQVKARDFTGNHSPFSNMMVITATGGLTYKYYTKTWSGTALPNFNTLTPVRTGALANVDVTVGPATTNYGMLFEGKINIPVAGNYTFQTRSDDGSKLYINAYSESNLVVNNDGSHGMQTREGTFNFPAPGMYPIFISYYFGTSGTRGLELYWKNTAHGINATAQRIADTDFRLTAPAPSLLPTAPASISASPVSYDKLNVTWTDNSANETGFQVYRSTTLAGPYQAVGIVGANTTSFQDTGLQGSTLYYYQVIAFNASGPSSDVNNPRENLGLVKYGIGGIENASGTGYIMYSRQNLFTRFRTPVLDANNSLQVVAVRYFNGQWQYDNNSVYTNFTPLSTDLLIASVNFTTDVITSLQGTSSTINGLKAGYASGDLTYLPNRWNNASNTNEYTVNGTYFNHHQGPVGQATTLPLPPAPATPANFVASSTNSTSVELSWSLVGDADGYKLYRSNTLNGNYLLHAEFNSKETITFTDAGLNSHTPYFYRILATNVGGNSGLASAEASTLNIQPVLNDIDNFTMRHSVAFDLQLFASDGDSDALQFSASNLPPFSTLTDYGDGSALLSLNPAETDLGSFENISITADDGFGGIATKFFNLVVNNNYLPTLSAIGNLNIGEGSSQNIAVVATDSEGAEFLTWDYQLPSFATLQVSADGNSSLAITPTYSDAGVYQGYISVTDQSGAQAERSFTITVSPVNPNFTVLVNYKATTNGPTGWNNIGALGSVALNTTTGTASGITAELLTTSWKTYNKGAQTGNNSGVFPDAVMKEYYYFGIYGAPETITLKLAGLSGDARYNLKFLASSVFASVPDNGTTVFTIDNVSVPVYTQGNTSNTANFSLVAPSAQGEILVTMSKAVGTPAGYLNAFSLEAVYGALNTPAAPANLSSTIESTGIRLNWSDAPYNETGYRVYRAESINGPYSEIATLAANSTTYLDATALENTTYFYYATAFNTIGESESSNTITQTLPLRELIITLAGSQSIYTNQQSSLTVSVSGSSASEVSTVIPDLPTFASYSPNATGGIITLNPTNADIGQHTLNITASDSFGKTKTQNFVITITEQMLYSVAVNFSKSFAAPAPWNNTAKTPALNDSYANLKNQNGVATPVSVNLLTAFGLYNMGATTGNNSGVVPDNVLKEYYYFGIYSVPNTATIRVSGLDYSNKYTFKFIGSSIFTSATVTDNGETNYSIGNTTVSLNVQGNTTQMAQIQNVTADANGDVLITLTKGNGASAGYINGLVIESYAGDPSIFYPSNLNATALTKTSIQLNWNDNSFNEAGFEVFQSTTGENGTYSLIGTVGANTTSFVNNGLSRGNIYYYKVRALLPSGASPFTNITGSGTIAFSVLVNVNGDVAYDAPIPWNNLSIHAQAGDLFQNFKNDDGAGTGINMYVVNGMEGTNDWGTSTGNDSGVFPDKVLKSFYWTNQFTPAAEFKLMNLDLNYEYNLGFFGSIVTGYYVITKFTADGITVENHQTNNTTNVSTIYGVSPNSNGEIDFRVQEASSSKWAIWNAMVVNAYPVVNVQSGGRTTAKTQTSNYDYRNIYDVRYGESNATLKAYPNSFDNSLTVNIGNAPATDATIQLLDIYGRPVFQRSTFLKQIDSDYVLESEIAELQSGLYLLRVTVGKKTMIQRVIRK
jgi:large repetitive protein